MGQVFVRASRRAKAHFRASETTRMYSSRHSALEAARNIVKAINAPGDKPNYYKNLLKKRLTTVLKELAVKRRRGSRQS